MAMRVFEAPETIPLSSGLSSVAAEMASPSLAHGEVATLPVLLTCRLLDLKGTMNNSDEHH